MNKALLLSLSAVAVLFSLSACEKDQPEPGPGPGPDPVDEIQTINVLAPKDVTVSTKGTSIQDGSALVFNWAVGDTLGIFPNKGNQVEFPITAAQSSTSATFDGGGWALKNNASYAAYYPFSVWDYHRDNETIMMDYTGQVQDGNGGFAHLSAYDFLASDKATPMNNAVTFQMVRQGSILYIDIEVPKAGAVKSLTISCNDAIFIEKAALDISGDTPVVKPINMTDKLTLTFANVTTTTAKETVRAYMAVQPVDFSQKSVTATIAVGSKKYWAPVTPRVIERGKAAFLRFLDDFIDESVVANPTATISDFEFDDEVTT
ncbi:MAG: hypothetical protein J5801_00055 [Bacteroidales bacterium]|nr:hypothetical protein [Bacteroidales bacterium]